LIELDSFKKTDKLLEFKNTIDLNLVNRKRTLLQLSLVGLYVYIFIIVFS